MDNQSRQKIDTDETDKNPLLTSDAFSSVKNDLQMADLGSVQTPFSPVRFLIITIGGIFLAEVIAMIFIYDFPHLPYYQQVLLDAGIMVMLIFPIVYYFSLRPLLLFIEKLQQLGNALQRSEERFALAYRSNPAALSITRVEDGSFIEVNDSFLRQSGYTRNEVIGHTPDELNLYPNPDEREKIKWLLLKNGSVDNFEMTTRTKSGEIRTLSVSTEAIELGGEVDILAIASDITERNRVQEQVREMALFPDFNPGAVLRVDASGRIEKANPAAIQIGLCNGAQLTETLRDLRDLDFAACIVAGTTRQVLESQLGERYLQWMIRGVPELGLAFLYSTDITERKRAEDSVRQLSRIVEQTEDTVVVTNQKGVIEYVNPAFERLTGFTRDEVLGKTPNILKSDLQDGQFYKTLWNTILDGNVFLSEIANRKKNGDLFYEVKTITPLRDAQGNITHFVATGKDITGHKLTEEKLRKAYNELELRVQDRTAELRFANSELSEEIQIRQHVEVVLRQNELQLNRAQEIAHLGSWELDLENNRLTWSDEVYRIFGLQPQEFDATYEAFLEAIHPDDRAMVDASYLNSVTEGRNQYEIEHRVERPNGEVRIVHEKCEHFKNEAGQIIRSVGMVHDITDRKFAEEVLRRSESLLRQTGEMAKVGGWELDLQTMRLTWTLETYTIHEVDPSLQPELEGALNFYAPVARAKIAEAVHWAIEEGQSYDLELPLITAKGRNIWVRTIGQAEFRDGKCVRIFGAFQDITERKQAEEHVTYQAKLLASVNDAIVGSDAQYRLNTWNSSAESMYGWKAEEILGRNGVELLRTEWLQEDAAAVMRRMIAEVGSWRGEATQLRKDGTRIFVEVSSIVLRDDSNQITGYVSVNRDITERKLAEEELRKAHDELELRVQERTAELASVNRELVKEIVERREVERQLLIQTTAMEAAANGILITDPQGIIQWTNPALAQITGYGTDELLGQNTRIFNSGKQDAAYYAQMWNTIVAGQTWRGETTNRRKDGSLYVEEQTITPVRDESDQIRHFIVIKQDVTQQKQVEEELELERSRLRKILDTMPDGVFMINPQYEVEYVNPIIEKEFGPVGEQSCYTYFHDRIEPCLWCKNEDVLSGKTLVWEHHYLKTNKIYDVFETPFKNSNGSISKFKMLHDITQRKMTEEELGWRNVELQALSITEREQRQLSEALVEAALVLNKHMKLDEILPLILEKIKEVIPYQLANIAMLDGESFYDASHQGASRWSKALAGMNNRFPLEDFHLLTKMRQSGQPLLIVDIQKEPEWTPTNGLEWCRSFLSAPLLAENQVIGFVNLFAEQPGFFTAEMQNRLVAFASHAAVAIQNAWLFEQVRASNDRLQSLSHRLVEIQENERLYIARELHDEAGQMLTSLMLDLHTLETHAHQPGEILKKVAEMEGSLNAVSESLHSVAMALRPASLDHLGLVPALRQQVESIGEKNGLKVSFRSGKFHERLPANMETELYRIVQEALTNVVRHAHASRVDVILTIRHNKLILIVEDDGDGFNPQLVSNSGHLGLFGMRERVDMIGGKLLIESAPGKGTTLIVEVTYAYSIIDRG